MTRSLILLLLVLTSSCAPEGPPEGLRPWGATPAEVVIQSRWEAEIGPFPAVQVWETTQDQGWCPNDAGHKLSGCWLEVQFSEGRQNWIEIYPDTHGDHLVGTLLHELGHRIGLGHHEDGIMAEAAPHRDWLTDEEIEMFQALTQSPE